MHGSETARREQLDRVGAETSCCGQGKSWGSLSLPMKSAPLLLGGDGFNLFFTTHFSLYQHSCFIPGVH